MKKISIASMSLFVALASHNLQAIDLKQAMVTILSLGALQKNQPVFISQNNVHNDLNIAAQQQLRNMKPYNTGFKNTYLQATNDDAAHAAYYLRGSYKQAISCDDDSCGC